jgi:hypothetical protein
MESNTARRSNRNGPNDSNNWNTTSSNSMRTKLKYLLLIGTSSIFDTAIKDLLTMQPGDITKWIISRKPIILQSRREANQRNQNHVRLLPTYFHPLAWRRKVKKPRSKRPTPPPLTTSIIAPLITKYFRRSEAPILRRRRPVPSNHLVIRPKLTQQAIQFPDDVI